MRPDVVTGEPFPPELAAVLRFAARHEGVTEAVLITAARQAFGLSVVRYRQRLLRAVNTPGAEAIEPATVRRLRDLLALRDARRRRRPTPSRGA